MAPGSFRFDRFCLDAADRQLLREGERVELNNRYLDALALLVGEQGRLVSKDRFMEVVWQGVPVTDEALTQCIRTLRKQLGDDAASPRFIETVPKHGYRFIAPVTRVEGGAAEEPATVWSWRRFAMLGGAGMVGGAVAGVLGGLFYGFAAASQPPGMGAVSVLLVLLCLTPVVALIGGAGVGFGIAAARGGAWSILGGAAGGLVVGAIVKLLALDAFELLFGRTPGDITGAAEGLLLGAAVGVSAWLTCRTAEPSLRRGLFFGGLLGAIAGAAIALTGGRLMGGSLDLLARHFPGSHLRLDQIGLLFGETGFGPFTQTATGALEGLLFGACIVGAMVLARRRLAA